KELWPQVALVSDQILRFEAGLGMAGYCVRTGEVVNVSDAYHDSRFYNAIDRQSGYRTRNVLAVGVRNERGEVIGAFEALNKKTGVFHTRDEESLIALAAHAAIARETDTFVGDLRHNQGEQAEAERI